MLDPREHGPRRKLLSRSFSRSYLVENWESIVREKALLAVNKIKADATTKTADVYNWWMLLASDVSAHLAFGESFGMLETGHVCHTSLLCMNSANLSLYRPTSSFVS